MYKAFQNLKLWGNIFESLYLQGAEKITELRYGYETGEGMWSKVIWEEEYLFQQKISNGKVQQRVVEKEMEIKNELEPEKRWASMRSQGSRGSKTVLTPC